LRIFKVKGFTRVNFQMQVYVWNTECPLYGSLGHLNTYQSRNQNLYEIYY